MTLARRLALLESRRVKAGVPHAIDPDLIRWIVEFHRLHGSYDPAPLKATDIALWANRCPAINLPGLLERFARVDAMT